MMDTSALKRSYDEMVGEAVESEKEKEIKKEKEDIKERERGQDPWKR